MFLINSRRSRFTVAPCSLHHQGHPLSRSYGAILQSSLTTVLPSALGYSTRLPVSVLVRLDTLQTLEAFLGRPSSDFENSRLFVDSLGYSQSFQSTPPHTTSTGHFYPIRHFPTPSLHQSTHQRRNINLLSHRLRLSASTKEPANPGRIYLPQETLGFRRAGFSPALSLLIPA